MTDGAAQSSDSVEAPARPRPPGSTGLPVAASWNDAHRVEGYLARAGRSAPREAGEEVLRTLLPERPQSLLDLGCGDGRLAAMVLEARPGLDRVVAVDASPPMLERAQARFRGDPRVSVRRADLVDPIGPLGRFDVIVTGLALHHLEDERKRTLAVEVATQLTSGGLFANLEVVSSGSPRLHRQFLELIDRPADDPEDRLASVESQLGWMREAGLEDVDCLWRWRGFALLVGWAR